MTTTTLATALQRIARLTPVRSANVVGDGAYVLTSPAEVPARFRPWQALRRSEYLGTGNRIPRGLDVAANAPAYVVTSYGVLIAWVTLDGQTHYKQLDGAPYSPRWRAMRRHQDAVRASWPERFPLDRDGEPTAYARLAVTTAS